MLITVLDIEAVVESAEHTLIRRAQRLKTEQLLHVRKCKRSEEKHMIKIKTVVSCYGSPDLQRGFADSSNSIF